MRLFEDNIYNLLGISENYILKNMRWRSEIIGTERTEIPEIPVAVIREVLANSFAHAVYNGRTSHEICIHPGMVTIYSPGEYASKHKPEDYMNGNYESVIRNTTIAKILYHNNNLEADSSALAVYAKMREYVSHSVCFRIVICFPCRLRKCLTMPPDFYSPNLKYCCFWGI